MSTVITVTSAFRSNAPSYVSLPSDFPFVGYDTTNLNAGSTSPTPPQLGGDTFTSICEITGFGSSFVVLMLNALVAQNFFKSVALQLNGGATNTYNTSTATGYAQAGGTINTGSDHITVPAGTTCWVWQITGQSQPVNFSNGLPTVSTFTQNVGAHGDIPNPNAWQDTAGHIPPAQFSAVPPNTNFPQNGDGRYWFNVNAFRPVDVNGVIAFIGDPAFAVAGTMAIQWSVTAVANDGSSIVLGYSTNGGSSFTNVTVGPQTQLSGIQNGVINVPLVGNTGIQIQVTSTGGVSSSTAKLGTVAIALTRNANEALSWSNPNPFDPINFNCQCMDNVVPTDTLGNLRARVMVRLGFANQATNPPPGMGTLINDFLISGQKYLYRRYSQLHTKRLFRWKVNPGQRFYSLKDNDEDVLCNFLMDPLKRIEWAGIQDTRNVWYPLIQGIPPQLYTMIDKPWRPARYEIRQCIELYPMPDQTYFLWFKAHFGLMSFAADGDSTTIDAELLFLHALANAKAHYGQSDANNVEAQANAYRAELIAGTHQTAHYIPGTIQVPPAVRPTLIQFSDQTSG